MQNPDIAAVFDEVADLLDIQGENPFRIRAYRNAARTIRDLPEPLADTLREGARPLTDIPGIGADLAEKITTLIKTGGLPLHRQLAAKLPAGLLDLLRVPGLGPKRVKLLHKRLRVKTAGDLLKALDAGKVTKLPGFGPKMAEKIRSGLGKAAQQERRLLLHSADEYARGLLEYLRAGGQVRDLAVAGSYRRRRESVGDLDVLATAAAGAEIADRFVRYPEVAAVLSQGPTRATVRLRGGLQVDLRVVEPESYGAALVYFTGSKAHNVELRKLAQADGLKLNEYGLYRGATRIAGATEEDVYRALGLDWIPPELREARGEIELARDHRLPHLVELADVKGDLQMHTDASDGKGTLKDMVAAARQLGYEYVAITDHSPRVSMSGLSVKRLRAQWKAIDALNARGDGCRVLKSVEMDILESGKMDLPDDVLSEADYVVATIHYGLTQTERRLTDRLLAAIAHPFVDAIGHPTGRVVGRRDSYPLDFDAVAAAAAAAGCFLELNGSERMDLPDTLAVAARERGVRFVLGTDAHDPGQLRYMRFAVDIARRAGLTRGEVINTLPFDQFRKSLKRARR